MEHIWWSGRSRIFLRQPLGLRQKNFYFLPKKNVKMKEIGLGRHASLVYPLVSASVLLSSPLWGKYDSMIYISTFQIQGFHYHQDIRLWEVYFQMYGNVHRFTLELTVKWMLLTSRLNLYLTQPHVRTLTHRIPYPNVSAEHCTRTPVHSRFSLIECIWVMSALYGWASVTVVTYINVDVSS